VIDHEVAIADHPSAETTISRSASVCPSHLIPHTSHLSSLPLGIDGLAPLRKPPITKDCTGQPVPPELLDEFGRLRRPKRKRPPKRPPGVPPRGSGGGWNKGLKQSRRINKSRLVYPELIFRTRNGYRSAHAGSVCYDHNIADGQVGGLGWFQAGCHSVTGKVIMHDHFSITCKSYETLFGKQTGPPVPLLGLVACLVILPFSATYSQDSIPALPGNSDSLHWYLWLEGEAVHETLQQRFSPPAGFERQSATEGSFGEWLRGLPLKSRDAKVHLFDGRPKSSQRHHAAVLDIDCGSKDLQQCADAVIRLNAEYLFAAGQQDSIHYSFTSGDRCSWSDWRQGIRPIVEGNDVHFAKIASQDSSHQSFRRYLSTLFMYAGTISLQRELSPVKPGDIRAGDVFVQGGSPGHAVIVVDVARNSNTNEIAFLLAQSYMPAQDIHVLRNHTNPEMSPWYQLNDTDKLQTPEWTFNWTDLRRFPPAN